MELGDGFKEGLGSINKAKSKTPWYQEKKWMQISILKALLLEVWEWDSKCVVQRKWGNALDIRGITSINLFGESKVYFQNSHQEQLCHWKGIVR